MYLLKISKAFNLHLHLHVPADSNRAWRGSAVSSQNGVALITSLIILIAITLSAVTAMQRSTLQVRMVGNMQHQQNVFNAAQSDLSALLEQLRKPSNSSILLNKVIQAEKQATGSTIEPFGMGELIKPTPPQNIKPTTNRIRVLSLPSDIPNSFKANEGSSAGTLVPYHFANKIEAIDTNNNIKSIQEVGFYYLAPAPN